MTIQPYEEGYLLFNIWGDDMIPVFFYGCHDGFSMIYTTYERERERRQYF